MTYISIATTKDTADIRVMPVGFHLSLKIIEDVLFFYPFFFHFLFCILFIA